MRRKKRNLYFQKDKKVNLVTKTTGQDDDGFDTTVYQYLNKSPLWAYTSQLSQEQTLEARAYGSHEKRFFVLNYRNDVKPLDYVEYKSNFYIVTRVDTTDDYNTELFIYVADLENGEKPSNIQPAD